jgi:type II secretion system protein N
MIANREMGRINNKILYTVYIIGTTIFFLYYLFPSVVIKEFLLSKIGQMAPGVAVAVSEVKPAFPVGLRFTDISVQENGVPYLDAEKLFVTPDILSLLAGKIAVDLDCHAYGGSFEATIGIAGKNFEVSTADVELNNLQIGDILILKERVPHQLSGALDGRLTYDRETDRENAVKGDLTVSDFVIGFSSPFHGLDKLSLQKVETSFESDRRKITVNKLANKGGDVDGSISGTILIRRNIEKSVLQLSGTLLPNPALTEKLGKLGPLVKRFMKKSSGDGFPIKLQGTLDRPRFF